MSKITPANFYNYFKECYRLDYKEFNVDNLLSAKLKFKWFVEGKEELFHERIPVIPFGYRKPDELLKELELYKLEKKLFYGCFFVLGKSDKPLVKDKRICAPLLLFPATIKVDEDLYYLEIDMQNFEINSNILSKFNLKDESLTKDMFIEEVEEFMETYQGQGSLKIKLLLDKYFTNTDTEEMLLMPDTWKLKAIKDYFVHDFDKDIYKIVPAAGTVLLEKSQSSLRVLNDLNSMASKNDFNKSIGELLGGPATSPGFDFSMFKSKLNYEQYQALESTYKFTNSVLIGPPGTGKSYTISAIVADAVVNGKSVLVVSKTKQAVEVIRDMLISDYKLKNYIVQTTTFGYRASLDIKVKKYLSGMLAQSKTPLNEVRIREIYRLIEQIENAYNSIVKKELKLADLEIDGHLSLRDRWRKFQLTLGNRSGEKLWQLFYQINYFTKQFDAEIRSYVKKRMEHNILSNTQSYRNDLVLYYNALRTYSFTAYKKALQKVNYANVLKVFPIWLAHLSDLNAVLPLRKNIFDLVIIDEATQCDIASALPAIYRAKNVLIAGDPNQLKHYSFVSRHQQYLLQDKYSLPNEAIFDYRNNSILDLYIAKSSKPGQLTFLREHFRSTPSLIEFSNKHFYEGQLAIMKSTPHHNTNSQIKLTNVGGTRDKKGVNKKEADAVMKDIKKMTAQYENEKNVPSIGIISPFSSQADYINRLIKDQFDIKTIKKFNILCGTPYQFQGSEREIVFLSFTVCDKTHHSAFIHASKPEVLNVAITRAKSFQYVYRSVTDANLNKDTLLAQYLTFVANYSSVEEEQPEIDLFQKQVVEALNNEGYNNIHCGYPVAGSLLDILVRHKNKYYFIDLIGYPGMFKEAYSLERYKTLARTGIQCFPLHYTYWKKDRQKAVEKLKGFLSS